MVSTFNNNAAKAPVCRERGTALKKTMLFAVFFTVFFSFGCSEKISKYQMVERGKYLVGACGVLNHHTPVGSDGKPDFSKFMAGNSAGYKGAWGIYYPKNLTPDNDTGIGMMTNEEVINMIKAEGANGRAPLYHDYYRDLTDQDLESIVAYLRTLPAILNSVPADVKPGEISTVQKKAAPVKVKPKKTPAKKAAIKKK
ncbi:MAG: hypothetical protein A2231_05020 [Candidatus Firestonebacteria bacterium RIFOXYA2_FULL_40_8]|nr:MAG: hypothetical protein A2231_05020 [Candidatus Firestonebacteria bacterium RIFOXYA2_FULL_40_8]